MADEVDTVEELVASASQLIATADQCCREAERASIAALSLLTG